jgi:alkanesulfonate monooxygenase SsuD/methylene tetrahydromethanopterin reductase-like flavin-dependent oxidoreductase (luciferase family)
VALRIPAYVAETAEQARSEPEASTLHAIRYAAEELITTAANPEVAERLRQTANTPYDDILKRRVLYGTPEAVVDRLQEYRDALGITGVVLEMNYGGRLPYERVINSIKLLTTRVAPKFK